MNVLYAVLGLTILCRSVSGCENRLETLLQESIGNAHDLSTNVQEDCNSIVGSFRDQYSSDYNRLISKSLSLSLQYMAMSGNFGRDIVQRPGFQQMFRKLSDERYETAKSFIKYAVKRGASPHRFLRTKILDQKLPVDPLPSFGRALNDAKLMFDQLSQMHARAVCVTEGSYETSSCAHDADVARRIQHHVDDEVTRINNLATLANRLAAISTHNEQSLALHIFDSYLAG